MLSDISNCSASINSNNPESYFLSAATKTLFNSAYVPIFLRLSYFSNSRSSHILKNTIRLINFWTKIFNVPCLTIELCLIISLLNTNLHSFICDKKYLSNGSFFNELDIFSKVFSKAPETTVSYESNLDISSNLSTYSVKWK